MSVLFSWIKYMTSVLVLSFWHSNIWIPDWPIGAPCFYIGAIHAFRLILASIIGTLPFYNTSFPRRHINAKEHVHECVLEGIHAICQLVDFFIGFSISCHHSCTFTFLYRFFQSCCFFLFSNDIRGANRCWLTWIVNESLFSLQYVF